MTSLIQANQALTWGKLDHFYGKEGKHNDTNYYYMRSLNIIVMRGDAFAKMEATFGRMIDQINNHLIDKSKSSLKIYLGFSRFSPSMIKQLFKMIKILNVYHMGKKSIAVYWSTRSNIDMKALGMDFKELCNFKFEIVNI